MKSRAWAAAACAVVTGALAMTAAGGDGLDASAAASASRSSSPSSSALNSYRAPLNWGSCPVSVAAAPFQCATAPAPLDYADPGGAQIDLSLIRLPAADPKQRIGSLFINFGGPGGAGVSILPGRAATVFSAAIRDHFDLVSWDTRGTGSSTAAMTPAIRRQVARAVADAQEMYPVNNSNEGYYISQCADIEAPASESVYDNLAETEDAKVPGFGRLATYDMTPCGSWPALHTDAYDGPWNRSRTTILVVNSAHDPATPYPGAVIGARELGNARLLTVNGDGHTSEYSEPSACREAAKQAYLISLHLPPPGTACPVGQLPWGVPPGS